MTDEKYIIVQQQIVAFAGIVKDLPLDEFLERIELCEAVAPMIDPTLYMQGADNLHKIRRIAEALKVFQETVR